MARGTYYKTPRSPAQMEEQEHLNGKEQEACVGTRRSKQKQLLAGQGSVWPMMAGDLLAAAPAGRGGSWQSLAGKQSARRGRVGGDPGEKEGIVYGETSTVSLNLYPPS